MKFEEFVDEKSFEDWIESLTDKELEEAMDVQYDYKDDRKGLIGRWTFKTKKNNSYVVYGSKLSEGVYHVMFTHKTEKGDETSSITNILDNPSAIMNSVYNIIEKEIVKKLDPNEIRFEAEGEKRQRMYDVVLKRYIDVRMKKYGFELQTENTGVMKIYRFVKKEVA